ncbi:hypothetical protein YC2023_066819 [Brassica napus]
MHEGKGKSLLAVPKNYLPFTHLIFTSFRKKKTYSFTLFFKLLPFQTISKRSSIVLIYYPPGSSPRLRSMGQSPSPVSFSSSSMEAPYGHKVQYPKTSRFAENPNFLYKSPNPTTTTMSRRLSYAEKGKGIANNASPPRKGRVIVPDFDSSELIRKHELMLIGRVTNPKYQRM